MRLLKRMSSRKLDPLALYSFSVQRRTTLARMAPYSDAISLMLNP